MQKINLDELKNYYDKEVTISGFVDNVRDLQWVQFLIIRDKTGKAQITIEKSEEINKEMVDLVSNLTLESTIKVTGKVVESPKVKLNGFEIPFDTALRIADMIIDSNVMEVTISGGECLTYNGIETSLLSILIISFPFVSHEDNNSKCLPFGKTA